MTTKYSETLIDRQKPSMASRLSFGEELALLGDEFPEVVALDADLSKSTRTDLFAKKFPDRFFEMGISESNMIGVAAGLASTGKVPFAASFACFLTGRFDQIRMSISFSNLGVCLVGTHAGVGIGEDGHSQMGLEDLGLMRSLPEMIVFQPADDFDTRQFMRWQVSQNRGPAYIRCTRQGLPSLLVPGKRHFAPGHWDILNPAAAKDGVWLLPSGGVVEPTIQAADLLRNETGAEIGIVNASWINPLDKSFLKELVAKAPRLVVTIEDHYPVTGLGGAVAEVLSGMKGAPQLLRIGVEGFGQSGTPEANYQHYGFTGEKIAAKVLSALKSS